MRFSFAESLTDPSFYVPLARAAEEAGFDSMIVPDSICYPEHSDSVYPYTPDGGREFLEDKAFLEPFALIPALGAVTERLRFTTFVLKLPIRHPVLVAKQVGSVAFLTDNRLVLGVGTSPWPEDYAVCDVPWERRGRRMDEALAIIRQSWSGTSLTFEGSFYRYGPMAITPKPLQAPMPLWVGGISEAAARRAARLGTGFIAGAGVDFIPAYMDECRRAGRPAGRIVKGLPFHAVSEDPDRAWAEIGPHLHYQRKRYVEWLNEAGTEVWPVPASVDDVRALEPDVVVTPGRARELIQAVLTEHPEVTNLYWDPALPGLRPAQSAATVELFAREVAPAFRG